MYMIPSREIRQVPRGWTHPQRNGRHDPLLSYETEEDSRAWYAAEGFNWDEEHPNGWNAQTVMPAPTEHPQIMAYETVSEGTPLTGRAFEDDAEGRVALIRDLVDSGQGIAGSVPDAETWAGILFAKRGLLNIHTGAFEA